MNLVKMTHQHHFLLISTGRSLLYTYTPVSHILYHLGPTAFKGDSHSTMTLTDASAHCWLALTAHDVQEKLKIRWGSDRSLFLVLVYQITRSQNRYLCKHLFAWLIPCHFSKACNGGLCAVLGQPIGVDEVRAQSGRWECVWSEYKLLY